MPMKPWPPDVIVCPMDMDVDIVPMGEFGGDDGGGFRVGAGEVFDGLVAEHDAPAERHAVGIALEDVDVVRRDRAASC